MRPLIMWNDGDPKNNPENTSRYTVNANINAEKGGITNEQSFDKVPSFPASDNTTATIIGRIKLNDGLECIFSVNDYSESVLIPGNSPIGEIGILYPDNSYRIIVRDNVGYQFNFSRQHQIEGTFKINYAGEYVVYWTDDYNVPRWLNLDNPQVEIDKDPGSPTYLQITSGVEIDKLSIFSSRYQSNIEVTAVDAGGSLSSGVYYITGTYLDSSLVPTSFGFLTNPAPVTVDTAIPNDNSFQGSPAGTPTNKKISIRIPSAELDPKYSFIKIGVIYKNNAALTAYEFEPVGYTTGADFTYEIQTLDTGSTSSVEALITSLASYSKAKTINQLDDVMYMANLEEDVIENLQPYINNIVIDYTTQNLDLNTPAYKDGVICVYDKGFMWDEVYSFMVSLTMTNGRETKAYHIPGRRASTIVIEGNTYNEDDLISSVVGAPNFYNGGSATNIGPGDEIYNINNDARIFHAINTADNSSVAPRNMGFWQNENETYPDTEEWLVKNSFGTQIDDFRTEKVRHHKFPHPQESSGPKMHEERTPVVNATGAGLLANGKYNITTPKNYASVNILGIILKNIVLPKSLEGKVSKINVYYTKRDANNRTILAQSINLAGWAQHTEDTTLFGQRSIIGAAGNFQLQAIERTANIVPPPDNDYYGFTPSPIKNEPTLQLPTASNDSGANLTTYTLSSIGGNTFGLNYHRTNFNGDVWFDGGTAPNYDNGRDYYCFTAFDLLANSTSVANTAYVKHLFKIKSVYNGVYALGDPASYSGDPVYQLGLLWNPNNNLTDYYGIESTAVPNRIRRLTSKSYVPEEYPGGINTVGDNGPFDTVMQVENYGGELKVLLEYHNKLLVGSTPNDTVGARSMYQLPRPGSDFAILNSYVTITAAQQVLDGYMTASAYLSNLCLFKEDIYYNAPVLDLVYTGYSIDATNSAIYNATTTGYNSTDEIYGGDVFTNFYGVRNKIDVGKFVYTGSGTGPTDRQFYQFSSVHYFVCQSASNINMRYEGDGPTELFYPKSSAASVTGIGTHVDPKSNFIAYNNDYNSLNDIRQPVKDSWVPEADVEDFPTRVIRSATNSPESLQDNYRLFAANDYIDLPKNRGEITALKVANNKLVIHLENALMTTLGRERINTGSTDAFVGPGDIFAVKPRDMYWTDNGYLGTKSQWAGVVTPFGYMFPDVNTGRVFSFNELSGSALEEISVNGQFNFFRDNGPIKFKELLEAAIISKLTTWTNIAFVQNSTVILNGKIYRSNTGTSIGDKPGLSSKWDYVQSLTDGFYNLDDNTVSKQGVGYTACFDYKYNRYILAKKDFILADGPTGLFTTKFKGLYSRANFNSIVVNDIVFYNGFLYKITAKGASDPSRYLIDEVGGVYLYGELVDLSTDSAFISRCFTIAYYPEYKGWASYYTYFPDLLFSNQEKFYISEGSTLHTGNSESDTLRYFDKTIQQPFIITPVFNQANNEIKRLVSFDMETKALAKRLSSSTIQIPSYLNQTNDTEVYLHTFNKQFVFDSYQISNERTIENLKSARNAEGKWVLNNFRDMTINNSLPLFVNNWYTQIPNSANISAAKHWTQQKRFVDYWFGLRLTYDATYTESLTYGSATVTSVVGVDAVMTITTPSVVLKVDDILVITNALGDISTVIVTAVSGTTYNVTLLSGTITTDAVSSIKVRVPIFLYLNSINPRLVKNIR